jgi:hypothetical protein
VFTSSRRRCERLLIGGEDHPPGELAAQYFELNFHQSLTFVMSQWSFLLWMQAQSLKQVQNSIQNDFAPESQQEDKVL